MEADCKHVFRYVLAFDKYTIGAESWKVQLSSRGIQISFNVVVLLPLLCFLGIVMFIEASNIFTAACRYVFDFPEILPGLNHSKHCLNKF